MKNITKKDLNERLLLVETLLGLHRVLPEQISNEQANNAIFRMQWAVSRGKELAEIEPKLKDLDQSVFNGLDAKWRFAAVDACTSRAYVYEQKPHIAQSADYWRVDDCCQHNAGSGYDTSNWQNSLIERDKVELTGSDLCRAMLERGDKAVLVRLGLRADDANGSGRLAIATKMTGSSFVIITDQPLHNCQYVIPINNQGKPLTAADVGL